MGLFTTACLLACPFFPIITECNISTGIVAINKKATFFFFNDTATTEIYTLSLHDALPICKGKQDSDQADGGEPADHIDISSQHEFAHPGFSNDPFVSNSIHYVRTFVRGHGSKVTMGSKKIHSNTCNHRSSRFVLKKWLGLVKTNELAPP